MPSPAYDETITLPLGVKFPLELRPPENFDPRRLETWPKVAGRLEFAEGKLLYMPPCGDLQQDTTTDVVLALGSWAREHAGFVPGSNEAGMHLRGETRAADVAIWRRAELGEYSGGLRRVPPVLAVEVGGPNDGDSEASFRAKARWYLNVGVSVVWLVLPEQRKVIVLTADGESVHDADERLPSSPELPDLAPLVAEFFLQIDRQ
ncbi:MAG TPA: Uma2 family endonuclease [Gammaproteobacteria bacterium]|nr:Uma2 family endonuclease [Gammaproteobacteria bacterium]